MKLRNVFAALTLAAITAPLGAQIADFSAQDAPSAKFGTYNITHTTNNTAEMWASHVENDEWIVTCVLYALVGDLYDATNNKFFNETGFVADDLIEELTQVAWTSINKVTGAKTEPSFVGGGLFNQTGIASAQYAFNRFNFLAFRPSIAFTHAPAGNPDGYDGAVICYVDFENQSSTSLDIMSTFLRIDTSITPNIWVEDPSRQNVNVSASEGDNSLGAGNTSASLFANVSGLSSGTADVVVSWIDDVASGNLGGATGVTPTAANPATIGTTNIRATDVYARRMQQQFDPLGIGTPGLIDAAGTTVNVSSSGGIDFALHMTSNGSDKAFAAWTVYGIETDDVAGLGASTGPAGAAATTESDDTYIRLLDLSATLTNGTASRVSQSIGDNQLGTNRIAYNSALDDVAVMFWDNTQAGGAGIGGDNTKNATAGQVGTPPVDASDCFLRIYDSALASVAIVNVSGTADHEYIGNVTGFGADGWVAFYGRLKFGSELHAMQAQFDATGTIVGTEAAYPAVPTSLSGQPVVYCWDVSSVPDKTLSLNYSTSGTPTDLRTGETAPGTPQGGTVPAGDVMLSVGNLDPSVLTAGGLEVTGVTVNGGASLTSGSLPATITVDVVIQNTHTTENLIVSGIAITPPAGFTQTTVNPSLPYSSIAPTQSQTFTVTFNVDSAAVTQGTQTFVVSSTGALDPSGQNVGDSANGTVSVTGSGGSLTGVTVSVVWANTSGTAITQIQAPPATNVQLRVTVQNGGTVDFIVTEITGQLQGGFSPNELANATWTPAVNPNATPAQTVTVAAGSSQVFTTTIAVPANVQAGTYAPAVTVNGTQGAASGSVTAAPTTGLSVSSQPVVVPPTTTPLPLGGGGGGCAIGNERSILALVIAMLGLAAAAFVMRRRAA